MTCSSYAYRALDDQGAGTPCTHPQHACTCLPPCSRCSSPSAPPSPLPRAPQLHCCRRDFSCQHSAAGAAQLLAAATLLSMTRRRSEQLHPPSQAVLPSPSRPDRSPGQIGRRDTLGRWRSHSRRLAELEHVTGSAPRPTATRQGPRLHARRASLTAAGSGGNAPSLPAAAAASTPPHADSRC